MSRLEKWLSDWVTHNLITSEQAQKIATYESSRTSFSWISYGFLILGVVVIGIGFISLVAANWEFIPDLLKLSGAFFFLTLLARTIYKTRWKDKLILFEVLLVFFMISCLAVIGLISQIYHTGGYFYQALLLWSLITWGCAAISTKLFTPFIWAGGFLSGIAFTAINSPDLQPLFKSYPAVLFMTVCLLGAVLAVGFQVLDKASQAKALKIWTFIIAVCSLIMVEIKYRTIELEFMAFWPSYFLSTLLILGIYQLKYKRFQKNLFLTAFILYLVPFHLRLFFVYSTSQWIFAICSILVLMAGAVFVASLGRRKLFQLILVMLGLRFLVLYFQALGGLATTGLGLIFSGIIILFMVFLWNRLSRKLVVWVERGLER